MRWHDYSGKTRLNCWSIITRAKFFIYRLHRNTQHVVVRTPSAPLVLTIFIPTMLTSFGMAEQEILLHLEDSRGKKRNSRAHKASWGMLKSAPTMKMHIISPSLHKYYAFTDAFVHNTRHTFNIMMCLCARTLISMRRGKLSVCTYDENKTFCSQSSETLQLAAFVLHPHPGIPRVLSV